MRKTIKEIIDKAELQSVTMKKVIQDVFAKYPDQDLNDQRNFIKDTAKEVNNIILSIYTQLKCNNFFSFSSFCVPSRESNLCLVIEENSNKQPYIFLLLWLFFLFFRLNLNFRLCRKHDFFIFMFKHFNTLFFFVLIWSILNSDSILIFFCYFFVLNSIPSV